MNQKTRFVVTGSGGQLGRELVHSLETLGEVVAFDRAALDITDFDRLRRVLHDLRPDVILNAAAYTNVDGAEREVERAMLVNSYAPGVIAECAEREGAILVHFSTDYVFSGTSDRAYHEADTPEPVNVYGQSKLAGERAVLATSSKALVFRISWLYSLSGRNFLTTICRLASSQDQLRIVADQYGCPTWARSVAQAVSRLFARHGRGGAGIEEFAEAGLFHMTSPDYTTWYGLASAIVDAAGLGNNRNVVVTPIPSAAYSTAAQRPARSVLDSSRLWETFQIRLPSWRDQLQECMNDFSVAAA